MNLTKSQLTILFEDPFWVGLYERESADGYEVAKVVFGAEPKDGEVYEYFLSNWHRLRFTPAMPDSSVFREQPKNPKRVQREAKKAMENTGIGTKAQQALARGREEGKEARRVRSKVLREAEARRQFLLRQEKRKEKHRGH